jgi:hypothetical protein
MSKSYIENESGYHKSAKEIMVKWLEDGGFNDLKWNGGKWYEDGVYMEYPLIDTSDEYPECGNAIAFNYNTGDGRYEYYKGYRYKKDNKGNYIYDENGNWISENEDYNKNIEIQKNDYLCPSYQECINYGEIPKAVLDIALVYKGCIVKGFEIHYTNKVSNKKKQKLYQHFSDKFLNIYEIDAHTILKQTKKPDNILQYCSKIL